MNLKKSRDDSKKQSSSSRKSDFNLGESDSKSRHRTNEPTSAESEREKHRSSKNREEDSKKKSREHGRRDDDDEKESRHRRREEEEDNRERRHHRKRDEDESDNRDKDRERRHRRKEEENEDKESRHHRKNKDDDDDRERRHHRRKDEDDESREKHRKSNKYDDEESSSRRKKYDEDDDLDRKKESSRRHHKSKDEDPDEKSSRKHRSSTRKDDSDRETNKSTKKEPAIEEEAYAAYDDDFENDFEDDSESEKTKPPAPPPKKEEAKSRKNYSSDEDTKYKSSKSKRNNRYDYDEDEPVRIVKANALVKVPTELVECYSSKIYFNHDSLDRQQRRAKDLLKTIELDKKSFSILDIDPSEMRTGFSSHLKNEKCQTNDDIFEIETQTDDIDYVTRWTQCPPEDSKGYGSEDPYNRGQAIEDNILEKFRLDVNVNDLQVFLNKASKVIETILNESSLETNKLSVDNKSDLQFSQGFNRFGIPKYLSKLTKQAVLTNCCFSRDDSNYFVCSYDIQTIPDKEGKLNASLLIAWNINEPASPHK